MKRSANFHLYNHIKVNTRNNVDKFDAMVRFMEDGKYIFVNLDI